MGNITFRVHEILQEKGISVSAFSEMADINYRTALDICKNQYSRIGLETLAKICDALNVTPNDVLVYKKS